MTKPYIVRMLLQQIANSRYHNKARGKKRLSLEKVASQLCLK